MKTIRDHYIVPNPIHARWLKTHFACPLCGKNCQLEGFDPENLSLDIRVKSFKGLGRGKGFDLDEEYSILGDEEFTPRICDRILDLLKLLTLFIAIHSMQVVVERF